MKLSVVILTYMHEQFISQTIKSVLMQEVDFEYELIISNDCSLDGTDTVIKDLILNHPKASCIHYINRKTNLGFIPNFLKTVSQCKGEYIALLDGDDYWIDPLKLKMQVAFLDDNKEYTLVGHQAINTNKKIMGVFEKDSFSFDEVYYRTFIIPASSIVYSNNIEIPNWFNNIYGQDRGLVFLCATKGKLKILPFVGSYYRIHSNSMEQLYKDDLKKSIRNINEHIVYYNLTKHLPKSTVLRKKIIKNHVDIILYCIYTFRFSYLIKAPYSLFLFLTRGRIYIN